MSDLSVEECLLCLRIPLGEILIHTFDLYDHENAKIVGEKAAELLREAYNKNRFKMCGKAPSVQMAASIYLAGLVTNRQISQVRVSNELEVSTTALRNRVTDLKVILEIDRENPQVVDGRAIQKRKTVKCSECSSLPPLTKWAQDGYVELTSTCEKTKLDLRTNTIYARRICLAFNPTASTSKYTRLMEWRAEVRAQYLNKFEITGDLRIRRTFRSY